jgi:hypothetical protein
MYRLIPLLAFSLIVSSALAQHSIEAFPDPYDEVAYDTLVLRNIGAEPVTLDSLRFASSLTESHGLGWYLRFAAYLGGEEVEGDLVCDPFPHFPCDDQFGLFGSTLAPGDSVSIFSLEAYCAVCRGNVSGGGLDDTLFVYGGGIAEPLEVEILNGNIVVSIEGGAPTTNRRVELYPNPARGRVTVRLDLPSPSDVEVRVFDGRGRLVAGPERHSFGVGEQLLPLSLVGLSAGMYHVEVRSDVGDERRNHRAVVVLD